MMGKTLNPQRGLKPARKRADFQSLARSYDAAFFFTG